VLRLLVIGTSVRCRRDQHDRKDDDCDNREHLQGYEAHIDGEKSAIFSFNLNI